MNIKNIMMLASCLIIAMPTTSLSVGSKNQKPSSNEKLNALVNSTIVFVSTGAIGFVAANGVRKVWDGSNGRVNLLDYSAGIVVGAAGLKFAQSVYNFFAPEEKDNEVNSGHTSLNINIK